MKNEDRMNKESRIFPRIEADIKIGYEFVKWSERRLDKIARPHYASIHDISVGGIGLSGLPQIDKPAIRQLIKGIKKARLAIFLRPEAPPLMTFARLVWSGKIGGEGNHRYGFTFIDISPSFYIEMMKFVNIEIVKHKKTS
jgi:hypothetical protein